MRDQPAPVPRRRRCAGRAPAERRARCSTSPVDRYRFAVGLGARRCCAASQPAAAEPHRRTRSSACAALFAGAYALVEAGADGDGLPTHRITGAPREPAAAEPVDPHACRRASSPPTVLTSGSTGDAGAARQALGPAGDAARAPRRAAPRRRRWAATSLAGVDPGRDRAGAAHVRLRVDACCSRCIGGAAFDAGRPVLSRPTSLRALAATPRAAHAGDDAVPPEGAARLGPGAAARRPRSLCATAPLSPQLAARAEAALAAPLVEIYGCTEAGQVATRRTHRRRRMAHLRRPDAQRQRRPRRSSAAATCREPTPLADVLEVARARRFRLLGRSNDLVNIAGKRSSLGHLNYHLNAIDGVRRRRVLDAARRRAGDRGRAPGRLRRRARAGAQSRSLAGAARAHRRRVPAAPHRRGRRAAARADRQAADGALRRARRAARPPRERRTGAAMDVHLTASRVDDRRRPSGASPATSPAGRCCPASLLVAEVLEAVPRRAGAGRGDRSGAAASRGRSSSRRSARRALRSASGSRRATRAFSIDVARPRVATGQFARADSIEATRGEERRRHRQPRRAGPTSASAATCRTLRLMRCDRGRRRPRASRGSLLHPIALYFLLASGGAARAIGALPRARARPQATWRDVYRHIHRFARDRPRPRLPAAGALRRSSSVERERHRGDARALRRSGDGVLLVGAHLGSFEALRALGTGNAACASR